MRRVISALMGKPFSCVGEAAGRDCGCRLPYGVELSDSSSRSSIDSYVWFICLVSVFDVHTW